jgi:CubicO group peptidase (beta-lactamase class C family)/acyl carrier protein
LTLPGQRGCDYFAKVKSLAREFTCFAESVSKCLDLAQQSWEWLESEVTRADGEVCQLAAFILSYALARLYESWNLFSNSTAISGNVLFVGASVGEFTAACLSGCISLELALKLLQVRQRLLDLSEAGMTLAVQMEERQLRLLLAVAGGGNEISIAAFNSSDQFVIAGPRDAVLHLQTHLRAHDYLCAVVSSRYAFHSTLMHSIEKHLVREFQLVEEELENRFKLEGKRYHREFIPGASYFSCTTCNIVTAPELTPQYWAHHLRLPVLLATAKPLIIAILGGEPNTRSTSQPFHLFECTLKPSLSRYFVTNDGDAQDRQNKSSNKSATPAIYTYSAFLQCQWTLSSLWQRGFAIDWLAYQQLHSQTHSESSSLFESDLLFASEDSSPPSSASTSPSTSPRGDRLYLARRRIETLPVKSFQLLRLPPTRFQRVLCFPSQIAQNRLNEDFFHPSRQDLQEDRNSPPNSRQPPANNTQNIELNLDTLLRVKECLEDSPDSSIALVALVSSTNESFHSISGADEIAHKSRKKVPTANDVNRSLLPLGCMTKVFTVYLIYDLIQQRRLFLTSTLAELIPETCTMQNDVDLITVDQLLSCASGLPFYPPSEDESGAKFSLYDFSRLLNDLSLVSPLRYRPGENSSYSVFANAILGRIIQLAWRKSLRHIVRENIYEKFKFESDSSSNMTPRFPSVDELGNEVPTEQKANEGALLALGLEISLADFARFGRYIVNNDNFSNFLASYSFSFQTDSANDSEADSRAFFYAGSSNSTGSFLAVDLVKKLACIVIANASCLTLSISTVIDIGTLAFNQICEDGMGAENFNPVEIDAQSLLKFWGGAILSPHSVIKPFPELSINASMNSVGSQHLSHFSTTTTIPGLKSNPPSIQLELKSSSKNSISQQLSSTLSLSALSSLLNDLVPGQLEISEDTSLKELGVDSFGMLMLADRINAMFGRSPRVITVADLYSFSTVGEILNHIASSEKRKSQNAQKSPSRPTKIALQKNSNPIQNSNIAPRNAKLKSISDVDNVDDVDAREKFSTPEATNRVPLIRDSDLTDAMLDLKEFTAKLQQIALETPRNNNPQERRNTPVCILFVPF